MKLFVGTLLLVLLVASPVASQSLYAEVRISSGKDDGFLKNGIWNSSEVYVDMAQGSVAGFRFQINANPNATIEKANLEVSYNWGAGVNSFFVYAEYSVNAPPQSANLMSRQRIPIRALWTNLDVTGTYGAVSVSPDLSDMINFVIKQPGWKSGNYINIFVQNANQKDADPYEIVSFEGARYQSQYNGPRLSLKGTGIENSANSIISTTPPTIENKPDVPPLAPLKECPTPPIPLSPSGKARIPIVLVMDDIQFNYLESVAISVVETTISVGVDLLLNVIPYKIEESKTILPSLQQWYVNNQC